MHGLGILNLETLRLLPCDQRVTSSNLEIAVHLPSLDPIRWEPRVLGRPLGLLNFWNWNMHIVIRNRDPSHLGTTFTNETNISNYVVAWPDYDINWNSIIFYCGYSFDFFKGLVRRKLDWKRFLGTFHKRQHILRALYVLYY